MKSSIVAKVGGSLFDLLDLRERLLAWVWEQGNRSILLVPGGGDSADVVRKLDTIHRLGEAKSHWLAIRMLSANAYFLAKLLDLAVASTPSLQSGNGNGNIIAVLDPVNFCENDTVLERSWRVTSDSIAAQVAIMLDADLTMLKSVDLPSNSNWQKAAQTGKVDEFFPTLVENSGLRVTWVNLRTFNATPRQ